MEEEAESVGSWSVVLRVQQSTYTCMMKRARGSELASYLSVKALTKHSAKSHLHTTRPQLLLRSCVRQRQEERGLV